MCCVLCASLDEGFSYSELRSESFRELLLEGIFNKNLIPDCERAFWVVRAVNWPFTSDKTMYPALTLVPEKENNEIKREKFIQLET